MSETDGPMAARWWYGILVGIVLVMPVGGWFLFQVNPDVTQENHILETGQVVCLGLAFVCHVMVAWFFRRDPVERFVRLGLATLVFSFCVRELDVDEFGTAAIWETAQTVVRLIAAGLWVGVAVYGLKKLGIRPELIGPMLKKPCVMISVVGCVFYLLSWPLDKALLPLDRGVAQLWEETSQLIACLLLFAASIPMITGLRGSGEPSSAVAPTDAAA